MSEGAPVVVVRGPRLVLRGVSCRRGDRVLFTGLDLDVAPGEVVWLRAANGFGKTTLLRVIAGLGRPDAGSVEWIDDARDARDRSTDAADPRVVYLGHANGLKDDLTVDESVRDQARLHGLDAAPDALGDAIDRVGLRTRRHAPIRTLSHGQRRRVALARLCLSSNRPAWILDEPFDALDAEAGATVAAMLVEHARRGGSVLLTSHVPPPLDPSTDAPVRVVRLDAAATPAR